MKLEEIRPGTFEVTLTAHELSVILAGARMSHSFMEQDQSGSTDEARTALGMVLKKFDDSLAKLKSEGGGPDR